MIYLSPIIIAAIFGVWGAIGKTWYWYPLNIFLLFWASGVFNSSYIQWLTRIYSIFALKAPRAFSQVVGITFINSFLWTLAYVICRVSLSINFRIILFFLVCILVSTVVAYLDRGFQTAITRTEAIMQLHKGPQTSLEEQ
jgi:hypothetical protein